MVDKVNNRIRTPKILMRIVTICKTMKMTSFNCKTLHSKIIKEIWQSNNNLTLTNPKEAQISISMRINNHIILNSNNSNSLSKINNFNQDNYMMSFMIELRCLYKIQ